MTSAQRNDMVEKLQTDILRLQGFKPASHTSNDLGLGAMLQAFPNKTFPLGAVHEFIAARTEDVSATSGFIAGLLSTLINNKGTVLWISSSRRIFPPALHNFGIQPECFIFVDLKHEKDILWTIDEALKCGAITAVVGEIQDMSFTASRRLQLAVEQSAVTGFLLRRNVHTLGTSACVSRWKISTSPSIITDFIPGIGHPAWHVELLRIRNGKPGRWNVQWMNGKLNTLEPQRHEQWNENENDNVRQLA